MQRSLTALKVILLAFMLVPVAPVRADGAPPLPRSCIGGSTPVDYNQPICCVSGYVYLNGSPTAGAAVTISAHGTTITTSTQSSTSSSLPYFSVSLDIDPLNVRPGDEVTISASAGGQTKGRSFIAQPGGQQVDIVLPQSTVATTWKRGEQIMRARSHASIAYDERRQRTVIFGGTFQITPTVAMDETWEWDGSTWVRPLISTSPPARADAAMTYDVARGKVVLFGGSSQATLLGDTWEWDGTTWTQRQPANSPPPLTGHQMVYDGARQKVVLFGGSSPNGLTADTWEWDGANWTRQSTSASPSARTKHAMAYDTDRQRIVLFGGRDSNGYLDDTWEFDGQNWMHVFPLVSPSARANHTMVYNLSARYITIIGGANESQKMADTWVYNNSTWKPSGFLPEKQSHHATSYQQNKNRTLLVPSSYKGLAWEWDGDAWFQVSPLILRSRHYGNVYHTKMKSFLSWDFNIQTQKTEFWVFHNSIWSEYTIDAKLSGSVAASYDQDRNVVVLFDSQHGRTWEWDGLDWINITSANQLSPRSANMLFDPLRHKTLLFGGFDLSSGQSLNDLWEWDGENWRKINANHNMNQLSYKQMMYDTRRNRVILWDNRGQKNRKRSGGGEQCGWWLSSPSGVDRLG